MKNIIFCLCSGVVLFTAGCGVNQESGFGTDEDQNGTRFVNNHKNGLKQSDRNVQDMSNGNPNFPNLSSQPGATSSSMGQYVDKARQVVTDESSFEPDEVWINGDQMWVTAHTRKRMGHSELDKNEAMLKEELERALPRFHMNVKITEQ